MTSKETGVKALMALLAALLALGALPGRLPAAGPASRLVSIHANQTPLVDVLSILSDKSGLNMVTSAEVEDRKISIHLKDTPVEEALNLVVRAAGLGYERIGNSILVAEQELLGIDTGLATHVIDLEFVGALEVEPLLGGMAEEVTADPWGNRIVVVASPTMMEQIADVVRQIDVPPVQIMLETEVIEVTTDDLLELGIDWTKIMKQTVVITESRPEPVAPDALPDQLPFGSMKFDKDNIYRQAQALELALDLLETEGKARILSRSKLATLNNRSAQIHIGDVIPYTVTGATVGGIIEVSVEKERVGVSLNVTPRVSGDGYITALVEPNVSSIVGWKGPNDEIPWTKERSARTQVRVRNGETFLIAGLLSEDTGEVVTKIPLLGDIPILGHLFRHTRTEMKQSDLIIKITPTIIS